MNLCLSLFFAVYVCMIYGQMIGDTSELTESLARATAATGELTQTMNSTEKTFNSSINRYVESNDRNIDKMVASLSSTTEVFNTSTGKFMSTLDRNMDTLKTSLEDTSKAVADFSSSMSSDVGDLVHSVNFNIDKAVTTVDQALANVDGNVQDVTSTLDENVQKIVSSVDSNVHQVAKSLDSNVDKIVGMVKTTMPVIERIVIYVILACVLCMVSCLTYAFRGCFDCAFTVPTAKETCSSKKHRFFSLVL